MMAKNMGSEAQSKDLPPHHSSLYDLLCYLFVPQFPISDMDIIIIGATDRIVFED